jgi:hypothetical protein
LHVSHRRSKCDGRPATTTVAFALSKPAHPHLPPYPHPATAQQLHLLLRTATQPSRRALPLSTVAARVAVPTARLELAYPHTERPSTDRSASGQAHSYYFFGIIYRLLPQSAGIMVARNLVIFIIIIIMFVVLALIGYGIYAVQNRVSLFARREKEIDEEEE